MADKIRKIADNFDINKMIIHQLIKKIDEREVRDKKIAEDLISISDKERNFVGRMHKSYHKKSSPVWGIFDSNYSEFEEELSSYINGTNDFYQLSCNLLDLYESILQKVTKATGGYMFLIHYTHKINSEELFMVMMINNKENFSVKNLNLVEIENIDLHKVDVACLINLTQWEKIKKGIETKRKTYLSFVKGIKTVSLYFKDFIGCDDKTTSVESTNRLLKAINDYYDEMGIKGEEKISKRQEIINYCLGCASSNKEIQLETISNLINPEDNQDFIDFATSDKYQVSALISGDINKLKKSSYISYSDKTMKIHFSTQKIVDNEVEIQNENDLILRNVPKKLIEQIENMQ